MPTATAHDLRRMSHVFHALSDETRLAIVHRLQGGEKCVCDLQDLLDAAQSRLSFHLKTLKDAGLVTDRRQGRWAYYSLVPGALERAVGALNEVQENAARSGSAAQCC